MLEPMYVSAEIEIAAPAATVWNVLTNPEMTKQYMHSCEVLSTWEPGSKVDWKSSIDGVVYVTGNVVKYEPGRTLHYTLFAPGMGIADVPENYLTVTYDVEPLDDTHSLLRVSQGDFSKVEKGGKRFEDTSKGWPVLLEKIRDLAAEQNS